MRPSTSDMSVITALAGRPAAAAVLIMERVRSSAAASVSMNAPDPVLISMTSPQRPAEIFLDRIDAVIRGTDSTLAVTSRMA